MRHLDGHPSRDVLWCGVGHSALRICVWCAPAHRVCVIGREGLREGQDFAAVTACGAPGQWFVRRLNRGRTAITGGSLVCTCI